MNILFSRRYAVFTLIFSLAVFFLPPSADAQLHDAFREDGTIDYSKVPEFTLNEAQEINQKCARDPTRQLYYDCDCFSLRFLEERLRQGLAVDSSYIELGLSSECQDFTEAVGHEYQECLNSNGYMMAGTDPEEMCACYANTFVKSLEQLRPQMNYKYLIPLKVKAKRACTDPKLRLRPRE
ncbi:MAG: hypothetical protein KTR28_02470 [Micavibrio sp.]|nr:hypothetical protein [Micavibrio sp.]